MLCCCFSCCSSSPPGWRKRGTLLSGDPSIRICHRRLICRTHGCWQLGAVPIAEQAVPSRGISPAQQPSPKTALCRAGGSAGLQGCPSPGQQDLDRCPAAAWGWLGTISIFLGSLLLLSLPSAGIWEQTQGHNPFGCGDSAHRDGTGSIQTDGRYGVRRAEQTQGSETLCITCWPI